MKCKKCKEILICKFETDKKGTKLICDDCGETYKYLKDINNE